VGQRGPDRRQLRRLDLLVEGNFGLFSASANGGGTAFFAHVGGFVFGVAVARLLAGRVSREPSAAPA
jgi:membrane associated rhomboid family serine protease